MADIINRLLLDTNNFDAKLSNSKKGVNDYQSSVAGMAKTAGAGMLKFAGAIGVVTGAAEVFTKAVNSSQATGDAWASTIGRAKTTVDEFFYSLATGDFSGFLGGLDGIISKARESIAALDQLGNTRISHRYFSAENESNIAEAQYTAKNKFAPVDERVAAFASWKTALEAQGDINKTLQHDLVTAITTSVETEIGASKIGVSMDDVRMALKIDVTNPQKRDELKKQYSEDYSTYKQNISGANNLYQSFDKQGNIVYGADKRGKGVEYRPSTEAEREKAIDSLNKKYREAIIVNAMLNKYSDDELTNIANMASEYQKLTKLLRSVSREYNETANEFNNSNKAVPGFTPVQSLEGYKTYRGNSPATVGGKKQSPSPTAGSIAAINEEIAIKNKELINATTLQARIAVQQTINELEARKISLQIETNKGMFMSEHGENKLSPASSSEMSGVLNGAKKAKGLDLGKIDKLAKIKSPIDKQDVNLLEKYQDNLYGISDAMRFMSDATSGGAESWLNWGASLLQSIAMAIPAIRSLIPALAAKTAGEAASSAAQIPLVGWLAAGGAAMSIISLFASLPSFSNGGVFEDGATFGDLNLARVNSGEMILNKSQQGNLFKLLNGSNTTPSGSNGAVSFRIQGKDLVGVLSNYNSQKKKVK